jgi:organic hydroperoxide reductase OsmC/OhrA
MMGTLATVLAKEKIRTFADRFQANVSGDIEDVDGVLKITRIHVQYDLKIPQEKEAAAREAMQTYLVQCPGAQSVLGCIDITHALNTEHTPEG